MYEPRLSETEDWIVNHHRRIFHSQMLVPVTGLSSLVLALAVILTVMFNSTATVFMLSVSVMVTLAAFADFFVKLKSPCSCGKVPVLSSDTRRGLAAFDREKGLGWKADLRVFCLVLPLVAFFCGVPQLVCNALNVPVLWGLAGSLGTLTAVQMFSTLLSFQRHRRRPSPLMISREEYERLNTLRGEGREELMELINFHSYIGNFDRAESLSQRLLLLAEQTGAD